MSTSTPTDLAGQDALFELVDLLPALVLPNNLLPMQEAAIQRGKGLQAIDLEQQWRAERADRTWDDVRDQGPTYCWSPTVCGPKVDPEREGCQPYILSADLRCRHHWNPCECVGDLIYRHLCTCGHVDTPRAGENPAAEDAMDHAWPGWRDLPILASSMPQERKQQTRWVEDVTSAYPDGWLQAGGPVRTARGRMGTRHVPGRTPFNGYDMGVTVAETYLNHLYRPGLYEMDLFAAADSDDPGEEAPR